MPAGALNVGLIGAGRIGRMHAENLGAPNPGRRPAGGGRRKRGCRRRLRRSVRVPQSVGDYRAVLGDPEIEAVVICSSTDTHARIIEEAARAGKHIFCEKPIALNLDSIDRALAAVERAGVKLQIGFNRRFDANYAACAAGASRRGRSAICTCSTSSAATRLRLQSSTYACRAGCSWT